MSAPTEWRCSTSSPRRAAPQSADCGLSGKACVRGQPAQLGVEVSDVTAARRGPRASRPLQRRVEPPAAAADATAAARAASRGHRRRHLAAEESVGDGRGVRRVHFSHCLGTYCVGSTSVVHAAGGARRLVLVVVRVVRDLLRRLRGRRGGGARAVGGGARGRWRRQQRRQPPAPQSHPSGVGSRSAPSATRP